LGSKETEVSIGATLSAARRHAGLSVADVSQRTRVRENIIEGIEHDDYAACGGDFYARGHIRAIAQAVGTDPVPLIDEFDATWRSTREITAAEAFQPSMPLRRSERRRVRLAPVLAALLLAVIGFGSYKLVSGSSPAQRTAAVTTHIPPRHQASAPAVAGSASPTTSASPSASPSATPSSTPPPQPLSVASVTAFGQGGTASGDNPQQAMLATSGNPATPWTSDWYTTPQFGGLETGTGLLVDMGQTVTITSVQLSLGAAGANVQLRVGGTPVLASLQTVATSNGAGNTVQFSLASPAHARYLLIWFTQLPPDSAGTYQASVYGIAVKGQR
jgi:cytoskeletal protein RodZ